MIKNTKKYTAMLLAGTLALSLTACGNDKDIEKPDEPVVDTKVEETIEKPETNLEETTPPVEENIETSTEEKTNSTTNESIQEEVKTEEPVLTGIERDIAEKDYLGLNVNKHQFLPLHCSKFGGDEELIEYVKENRKVELVDIITHEDDNVRIVPTKIELDSDGEHIFLEVQNKTENGINVMIYDGEYVNINGLNVVGELSTYISGNKTEEIEITIPKVQLLINNIEKIKDAEFTITVEDQYSNETSFPFILTTDAKDYEQKLITENNDLRMIYEDETIRVGILTEYLEPVESDVFHRIYFAENKGENEELIRIVSADENTFKSGAGRTLQPNEKTSFIGKWNLVGTYNTTREIGLKSDTKVFKMDGMFPIDETTQTTEILTEFYEGFDY